MLVIIIVLFGLACGTRKESFARVQRGGEKKNIAKYNWRKCFIKQFSKPLKYICGYSLNTAIRLLFTWSLNTMLN